MEINPIQATNALTAQLNLDIQNNNVQQQLTQLPINQVLLGAVAGNDKNGNFIIKLAGNDLILSSPVALAKNAQVALKVENVSGSIVAQLLSVDGKLPATQPQKVLLQGQQNPQNQNSNSQPQNSQGNNQSETQANNQTTTLRIVSVLPQGSAKPADISTTPQTSAIISDTVELSSPPSTPLSAIVIAPATGAIQNIRAQLEPENDDEASSELEENLPDEITPGTNLKLKITGTDSSASPAQKQIDAVNRVINTPNSPTAEPDDTPPLQTKLQNFTPQLKAAGNGNLNLNGIVLHSEQNGEVLLQTALGKVLVNAGQKYASVEKGSVLNLQLSEITPPDDSMAMDDDSPLSSLTKQWPALESLDQHPDTDGSPILNKLAGTDTTFAARLNSFVNAVKSGDIQQWLGNNYFAALAASEDGKDIISKLKGDLTTLRENFATPNQNGWQTMLFPVFDGQQLNQARLHVKYLPDEDGTPTPKAGTRFLVEIDTSYFGEIQMDGLVRANMSKHFDLTIRTHDPLDLDVKQDINHIFNDASEITGFKGNLEFSVARQFPNNILGQQREQNLSAKIDHNGIEA